MAIQLDTPYLEGGIRSTNFFNGRMLSGEDLTEEQAARAAALERLGRAIGEGVAYGLEVSAAVGGSTATDPVVTVKPGLGLNGRGQALELTREVQVSLLGVRADGTPNAEAAADQEGAFGACSLPASVYVAGTGVYLLTIAPAGGREGRAVASGLGGISTWCDARRLVEGVQFRLVRLDVGDADLLDAARLRNRVAHHCLGTTDARRSAFATSPFGVFPERYGLVDALRPHRLTECDVPLAVLHWKDREGIRFVDLWSVRRRPARVDAPWRWPSLIGDRRAAEGEAAFLQFQEHLEALLRAGRPELVRAVDAFAYLPAAGLLPIRDAGGATSGFSHLKFFEGFTYRTPVAVIQGAHAEALLRMSASYPPIEIARKELVWLYLVRENSQAQVQAGGVRPQPYLVFTSGYMPYQANPRSDAAHWSYGNYALP